MRFVIIRAGCLAATFSAAGELVEMGPVYFQAHRGGMNEVPENTLPALEHAWAAPGAVPEIDLQTTSDGIIVCMHDDTPARTTDAPEPWRDKSIAEIPFETLRQWDAGVKFNARYAGTRVPALDEVFDLLEASPQRQLYLDLKAVDVQELVRRIQARGIEKRIIFVHGSVETCLELSRLYDGARTMTWLSGTPDQMKARFEELRAAGFPGISQLQFHLRAKRTSPKIEYVLDPAYLGRAVRLAETRSVAIQVRPFAFDAESLHTLIDLGIQWFVTDNPRSFSASVREALSLESQPAHQTRRTAPIR